MKDELANKLLRTLVDVDEEEEAEIFPRLHAMAELKWDSYEGFRAGQRFMESLARWLPHLGHREARLRWLKFLLEDMIFVSAPEVDHLIALSYPDHIRPAILERVARVEGIPRRLKARLHESPSFKAEQRRTLVLGLSDGARLDVLRRNSSLSHEQFVAGAEVPGARRQDLQAKLASALEKFDLSDLPASFNHLLVVDDFYGSGTSLIDFENEGDRAGELKGKVSKLIVHANEFVEHNKEGTPLLTVEYEVTILLYMASEKARKHILDCLKEAGLDDRWHLEIVQVFADKGSVT